MAHTSTFESCWRQTRVARLCALLAAVCAGAVSDRALARGPEALSTVIPVSGARFVGRLVAVSDAGQLTFNTGTAETGTANSGTGQRNLAMADLVCWGRLVDAVPVAESTEPTRGAQVWLAGGGLLVAEKVRTLGESLVVDTEEFAKQSIPLERVAAIMLRPPLDLQQRDRLMNRLLDSEQRVDRVPLENGDELTGTILSLSDAGVELESQGQKQLVPFDRVAALAFDASLAERRKPGANRILAGFRDGSRLIISHLLLADNMMKLTLEDGATWDAPAEALVCLMPLDGKWTFLSDLKPEAYRHLPFLNLTWTFRNDANATGTQLRAGGAPYAKGLGMHSAARLTYRLSRPYRTFEADIAIDEVAGDRGSAVFAVYADDKLAFKSNVIRGGAAPLPVKVDIAGAKRVSLIVEYADRGDELDRANWLYARVAE